MEEKWRINTDGVVEQFGAAHFYANAVAFTQLFNKLALQAQPPSLHPAAVDPKSPSPASSPTSSSASPSPLPPDSPPSDALATIGSWGSPSHNAFVLSKEAEIDVQPPKTANLDDGLFEVSEMEDKWRINEEMEDKWRRN